jgi:hypothetical protein
MLIPLVVMAVRVVENPGLWTVAYAGISFLCFDLLASWQRTFSYEYHHLSIWMTPMLILMYMTLVKPKSQLVEIAPDSIPQSAGRRLEHG